MLNDLKEIIAIPGVNAPALENAPFGQALRDSLDWFLAKARSYGLTVGELDGYAAYAEYGEGAYCIGILCHVDVVPAPPEGWTSDPFTLDIRNGKAYGRGTADDKGPLVAALHTLKALKDKRVKLNHRVRLIVGCNEECGSACMHHYAKHGEIPVVSIVPDADFPVINSEKGILHVQATVPVDADFVSSIGDIAGGTRPNIVPDRARARLKKDGALYAAMRLFGGSIADIPRCAAAARMLTSRGIDPDSFGFTEEEDCLTVEARGVAGHAMAPHKADNALYKLFALLGAFALEGTTLHALAERLRAPLPESLGIAAEDEQTGKLTANLGSIELRDGTLSLVFDVRLPITAQKDAVIKQIRESLPNGSTTTQLHHAPNLYYNEDSPLIRTLIGVYEDATGTTNAKPVQTGGGTYARSLPESVAFGPTFPGMVTDIHNVNECIDVDKLLSLPGIYEKAVVALDSLYTKRS